MFLFRIIYAMPTTIPIDKNASIFFDEFFPSEGCYTEIEGHLPHLKISCIALRIIAHSWPMSAYVLVDIMIHHFLNLSHTP